MRKNNRIKIAIYSFFILLLLIPVTIYAADVKEYFLSNGLKVIIIEEHKAPIATFQIWYKVGAVDEPMGKSGLSHLLEHMMFKGTKNYGPSELSRIIQKNGGTDNAHTTKDYTTYFEILPSDRINIAIKLEADRMKNLLLDPKEVASERNVVMEERRLRYEDDPQNSLFEDVVAAAFKVHPYQKPVIGWMSDIQSIDLNDLSNHYKTYYSPNNAVIIIVGDIKPDEILKQIKSEFENIPHTEIPGRIKSIEPEQKGERRIILKREAEVPAVMLAYHVPNFPHEDSYALDILSVILSGGKSSRLYQSMIYEKKIAIDASADYIGFSRFPHLFYFFAVAVPDKTPDEIEKALYEEIEKIKKEGPSENELQKAKNQIEASFIMEQDSIYMQAMKYGLFEILGDWKLIDKYLEGIRKVSSEDITRVVKNYFIEENRTTGILIPAKKVNSKK
ncbi:MAG: insulinase family protein [Nitrospirae bacterium]|nr:insulinase family protein [Nitrospirota bacterium]